MTYSALYDVNAINGTLIWNSIHDEGVEDYPGVLTITGHDGGLTQVNRWFFLIQEADIMMAYYCGTLMTWRWEGLVVLTKGQDLNHRTMEKIERKLNAIGLVMGDLCDLDPKHACSNAPITF